MRISHLEIQHCIALNCCLQSGTARRLWVKLNISVVLVVINQVIWRLLRLVAF